MSDVSRKKIIPVADLRKPLAQPIPAESVNFQSASPLGEFPLMDRLHRPLEDLRISVTDRCNFRCGYCMPKEIFDKDYAYLPHADLLSFEEITRIARQAVSLGVRKIRLTGGEPLLRKNLEVLVAQLAALRTPSGEAVDLTLTSNGSLLPRKVQALKYAGLGRITISLDALDDTIFRRMNDVDFPVADVLAGIEATQRAGFTGIKVNMVVKRGVNNQEIIPMARHFRNTGITLRFIEYMDVGTTNGWRMDDVVPSADVIAHLGTAYALLPLDPVAAGETAQRWGYANAEGEHDRAAGEIGVISSVTQAFCKNCTRARLSTQGQLYLCLFAAQGYDLRALVRNNPDDAALAGTLQAIWSQRTNRYSELRSAGQARATDGQRVEMSYIGG